MPEHLTPILSAAYTAEVVFFLAGLFVWWRVRSRPQGPRLARWPIAISDFFFSAMIVVGTGFLFLLLTQALVEPRLPRSAAGNEDARTVFYSAALELGLLAGILVAYAYQRAQRIPAGSPDGSPARGWSVPVAGLLTFLAVRPATDLTGLASEQILHALGLPSPPEVQMTIFLRLKSPLLFTLFFLLATVIAPMAEELVFRAGLFRYLRTRLPRWAALLLPALFFALLHLDWKTLGGLASLAPLTALAIVFSLAYERTGRIGTAMIAHSLFNLTNILFLLAGMRA